MRHLRSLVILLASCSATWAVGQLARAAPAKADEDARKPAAAPTNRDVIELGGIADEVRTGGKGRYAIFHVKGSDKLTVVDVVARKVLKPIPAPGDFHYAANDQKLLLVLNSQRIIQRWDLKTQEREKSVILVDDKPIRLVSMGSSGAGPLAVWPAGKLQFWDVNTLKPLTVRGEVVEAGGGNLWPSADGLTFCAWGWTSGPYQVMRLSGVTGTSVYCELTPTPTGEDYNESWAMPSADGSMLVRHGARFFDRELAKVEAGPLSGSYVFPTEDPRFLIGLRRITEHETKGNTASVIAAADLRVLDTLRDMEPVTGGSIGTQHGRFGTEPRVRYLPAERLLISIPDTNDKVVVRDFDLERSLQQMDADYLYVISKPPTRVPAGSSYSYQIEALSKAGGVKFKVEDAPAGLAVSEKGLVTWRPEESFAGRAGVVIAVSDASGQETMHSIVLNVMKGVAPEVAAGEAPAPKPGPAAESRPPGGRTRPPAPATGPAAKPSPAVIAQLAGVWTATPPLDHDRIRAAISKQGAPPDQLDAAVAKFVSGLSGFRVVYAFNADGSVIRSFGTDADPHATAASWELMAPGGPDALRVRIRAAQGQKSEELSLKFTAPDRFETALSSPVLTPGVPVVFSRGKGPAPVVAAPIAKAGGAGPATREADPKVVAELIRIGKNLAADLDQQADDEMGEDPGPIVRISAGHAMERVEMTAEGARIIIGGTEVKQHTNGGPTTEVHTRTLFDVRRQADKWTCTRATRVTDFDDPARRATTDVTGGLRRAVDAAQGIKVQKAQTLNEGDAPLPGEPDQMLKDLAGRLAKDVQAGMRANQNLFPEARGANVQVARVSKTKNGVSILLGMESEYDWTPNDPPGPSEFLTVRTNVNVTLRALDGGKWNCVRATSQLDSMTGKRGPVTSRPGPERDMTADVQEWLDGPPKPAAPGKPTTKGTTRPAGS